MKLSLLTEGEVERAGARIVDVKNKVALYLIDKLKTLGFSNPKIDDADDTSDEVIIYTEAGVDKPQMLMIRVISDSDIQIQVPRELAVRIGCKEFNSARSIPEAEAVLNNIANLLRQQ
jgi:hypothetical protein